MFLMAPRMMFLSLLRMTYITLPPNYIKLDLTRSHAMILSSPPPLPHPSLTLVRFRVVRVTSHVQPNSARS
jgi:hypothetical protein